MIQCWSRRPESLPRRRRNRLIRWWVVYKRVWLRRKYSCWMRSCRRVSRSMRIQSSSWRKETLIKPLRTTIKFWTIWRGVLPISSSRVRRKRPRCKLSSSNCSKRSLSVLRNSSTKIRITRKVWTKLSRYWASHRVSQIRRSLTSSCFKAKHSTWKETITRQPKCLATIWKSMSKTRLSSNNPPSLKKKKSVILSSDMDGPSSGASKTSNKDWTTCEKLRRRCLTTMTWKSSLLKYCFKSLID